MILWITIIFLEILWGLASWPFLSVVMPIYKFLPYLSHQTLGWRMTRQLLLQLYKYYRELHKHSTVLGCLDHKNMTKLGGSILEDSQLIPTHFFFKKKARINWVIRIKTQWELLCLLKLPQTCSRFSIGLLKQILWQFSSLEWVETCDKVGYCINLVTRSEHQQVQYFFGRTLG